MKYSEVLKNAVSQLKKINHDEAEIDAWYLMEEVTGFSRAKWFLNSGKEMPEDDRVKFETMVNRLSNNEPVSYIIGSRDFMGLKFYVNPDVLIPRQDTELLVEEAVQHIKENSDSKGQSFEENYVYDILDMCTGSGCIAISIKKMLDEYEIPSAVKASDISLKALEVAKKNAGLNMAEIDFIAGNMFENISGKYDVIVSNPPYIPGEQLEKLDEKVLKYEPDTALYGGEDGLDFYRIIGAEAGAFLKKGGRLMLEIGYDQGESVPEILEQQGFSDIRVLKDYNHLDRVVIAEWT
ncbi:MAG: peptide chain release factor N(5)-glutamine methyltransferase [Lachnospiraceae bacterium]